MSSYTVSQVRLKIQNNPNSNPNPHDDCLMSRYTGTIVSQVRLKIENNPNPPKFMMCGVMGFMLYLLTAPQIGTVP